MIFGLSHVFGEAFDLDTTTQFWQNIGWRRALALNLVIPAEKRAILKNSEASQVTLHYLERIAAPGTPGIEFVKHTPPLSSRTFEPAIRVLLPARASAMHRDPDGNTLVESPTVPRLLIEWNVPDADAARERLRGLGFSRSSGDEGVMTLESALFAKRGVSVALRSTSGRPKVPRVDEGGWNGLSLLVRDIDSVAARLPITARQSFSGPANDDRDVGFYAGDGVLLEFLAVRTRQRPQSRPRERNG